MPWWALSPEAYQAQINEKVQNAVKNKAKGYNFTVSASDLALYNATLTALTQEYAQIKAAYEAKYTLKLLTPDLEKTQKFEANTVYLAKIDDNHLRYVFKNNNELKKGSIKIIYEGPLILEAADFTLVKEFPKTLTPGKLYFVKNALTYDYQIYPNHKGNLNDLQDLFLDNKTPLDASVRDNILVLTSKRGHTPSDYVARFKPQILKSIAENGHLDRSAILNAEAKKKSLLSREKLENRYIQAVNHAINQYGQGYDFRVNGLCKENIIDVRGTNNNCGANCLFHILLENLEKFDIHQEPDKSLLEALQLKLVQERAKEEKNLLNIAKKILGHSDHPILITKDYNANSIKQYIREKYDHGKQDDLFGPVIRKHLATILEKNHNTVSQWRDSEEKLSLQEWQEYYKNLGDEKKSIMLTIDQIAVYSNIMNFKLNTYALREDGLYHSYANPEKDAKGIKFEANIVNINNYHWQYDVTPSRYLASKASEKSRLSI